MKKLQFYANMSFMIYVPYSTFFVQENTSKGQEINKNAKANSLQVSSSRLSEILTEKHCQSRFQLA